MVIEPDKPHTFEDLLAQTQWLRRLAEELVPAADREDLVQEVLLSATRRERDPEHLRGWLATVARNLATRFRQKERNRRAREQAVARFESAEPSAAETVEGFETHHAVVNAVMALKEPYRTAVLLRFWEDLPLREVAERTGVPAETARTRIRRGVERLRQRLDEQISCRSTWALALLKLNAAHRAMASAPILTGVLGMKKAVTAMATVALLLAGGLWYSGAFTGEPLLRTPAEAPRAVVGSPSADVAATETRGDETPIRRDVTAGGAGEPTTGSLHATVIVRGLEVPVAEVAFTVWTMVEGNEHRFAAEAVTGADGTATVEGLAAGEYNLRLDRFDFTESFVIDAGSEQRVQCRVRPGVMLTGIVVDPDGRPVAGAEVRTKARWNSVLLARTAADGTFRADHVPGTHIWAAGLGRRPSKRHGLDYRSDSADLRLVLGAPGTQLFVRVRDEQGESVADARVYVGLDRDLGSSFLQLERHDGRTNADGEFTADWVKPGHVIVAAIPGDGDRDRAAMQRLIVEEGVPAEVLLQLGSGAIVTGVVKNENDHPVAGAKVWESCDHSGMGPLDQHGTKSAADGSFVLRGLLPGPHWLGTERGGTRIDERVELVHRQQLKWDPVLAEGAPIAVRVLGPDGQPMKRLRVNVLAEDRNPKLYGRTDGDGRCRFEQMQLKEHTVQVLAAGLSVVVVERVLVPNATEVVIRLDASRVPSSRITGRIVDVRGQPVANCEVSLHANSNFQQPQRVDQEGRFTTDLLPPGKYSLGASAKTAGLGWGHARATLTANEEHDVGDIVLPATAELAVRIRARDGGEVSGAVLRISGPGKSQPSSEALVADEVDGVYRKEGMNPRAYLLRFFSQGAVPQTVPITLTPGERRELDLVVERAVPVTFEIRCRLGAPEDSSFVNGTLSVTNATGVRVVYHSLWGYFDDKPQRIKRLRFGLAPGTYQVHAKEFKGKETDRQIEVLAAAPTVPFVVDLR
ncbi:MAG: sigma-70 family RNA polymerase sigma factor [bacterium]|nr:sigma-70 family RNA polymerase sigma factor [bacterium]